MCMMIVYVCMWMSFVWKLLLSDRDETLKHYVIISYSLSYDDRLCMVDILLLLLLITNVSPRWVETISRRPNIRVHHLRPYNISVQIRPPSWISTFDRHFPRILQFYVLVRNFTKIWQFAAELCIRTRDKIYEVSRCIRISQQSTFRPCAAKITKINT